MDQLIDAIRAATAPDATAEAKATGVQACRTIAAALDTEPGKSIVLPGTPPTSPPAVRPSIDQALDMIIARLTVIANEHDKSPATASPPVSGLRVPVVRAALPRVPPRSASRPAAAKAPTRRKP